MKKQFCKINNKWTILVTINKKNNISEIIAEYTFDKKTQKDINKLMNLK